MTRDDTKDLLGRIQEVLLLIANDLASRKLKYGDGEIDCPYCGGRIRYSIPRPRMGQVACSTKGCIRFLS